MDSFTEHPLGSAFATDIYVVDPDDIQRIGEPAASVEADSEVLHRQLRTRVVQVVWGGAFEPPRLPQIALEVMAAADDPDSSAESLARLIHRDQFLAVRVLRIANSAAYRPADRRIYGLAQAIARLGTLGTRNVVVAAAMGQSIYRGPRAELLTSYWRASVGSAVGFQLVEQVSGGDAQAAFLAGLLHNVGKPVLVWILDDMIRTGFEGRVRFEDVGPELIHLLHAKIGTIIAGTWNAPQGMIDLIAHHHDRLPPARQRGAVRRLRLANLLWELWERDPSVAVLDPALATHSAFSRCGFDEEAARRILECYPGCIASMLST